MPNDNIQFYECRKVSEKIVELTIDMKLNSGQFITESNSLEIVTKIDGFEWQSFMVDPVKSRRFDWTDEIIRSASGDARIQGRFICNSIPSEIEVTLSVCTDQECLPGQSIILPILDK